MMNRPPRRFIRIPAAGSVIFKTGKQPDLNTTVAIIHRQTRIHAIKGIREYVRHLEQDTEVEVPPDVTVYMELNGTETKIG